MASPTATRLLRRACRTFNLTSSGTTSRFFPLSPLALTSVSVASRCVSSSSDSVISKESITSSLPSDSKEPINSLWPPSASISPKEEQFIIPNCLVTTESIPPTHHIHVASIQLRAYSDAIENLELMCDFARKSAYAIGIPASGIVRLPTRTTLWTVPKSPFVHKKSQENFWRKTHSRVIKLWDSNDQVIDRWFQFLRIHSLPGVGMKAELFRYHEPGVGKKLMQEVEQVKRSNAQAEAAAAEAEKAAQAAAAEAQTKEETAQQVKNLADQIVQSTTTTDDVDSISKTLSSEMIEQESSQPVVEVMGEEEQLQQQQQQVEKKETNQPLQQTEEKEEEEGKQPQQQQEEEGKETKQT